NCANKQTITQIYTLSLHDALPILSGNRYLASIGVLAGPALWQIKFKNYRGAPGPFRARPFETNGRCRRDRVPPAHQNKIAADQRSEEHTSELQSREKLVCRLLLEK